MVSCTTLPRPGDESNQPITAGPDAGELVQASAQQAGDAWGRELHVTVSFDGRWWPIVERVQPGLVDSGYRKASEETYDTSTGRVTQVYTGPLGQKQVERMPERITVEYDPAQEVTDEQRASAALVADAYQLFVLRSRWLAERGRFPTTSSWCAARLNRAPHRGYSLDWPAIAQGPLPQPCPVH